MDAQGGRSSILARNVLVFLLFFKSKYFTGGIMTKVTYPNREIYFSCKGIADGEWCWTEDVNTGCWWISNCKHGVCEGNDASGNGNT